MASEPGSRLTEAQGNTPPIQVSEVLSDDETFTIRPSVQNDAINELLASLTFTSHVYADEPSLRSVMIDGQVYREGDTPRAGLDLVAITNIGVVLRYRGREVVYNVLEQWE